jgi:MOSC domain-containing protein YiiM
MDSAQIVIRSVNAGQPKIIGRFNGEEILSGIAKAPITAPLVIVRAINIEGDGQADLEVHGGFDKAIYAYPAAHWPWWTTEKNLSCGPGTFGENLTLDGIDESDVRIGDRFRWGDAVLEISQPRAPCYKLGMHTRRPDVPGLMTLSGRCGWYLRVIAEGSAPTHGAALVRIAQSDSPTVREAFTTLFSPRPDREALHRIHASPALAEAWRGPIAKKIAALRA